MQIPFPGMKQKENFKRQYRVKKHLLIVSAFLFLPILLYRVPNPFHWLAPGSDVLITQTKETNELPPMESVQGEFTHWNHTIPLRLHTQSQPTELTHLLIDGVFGVINEGDTLLDWGCREGVVGAWFRQVISHGVALDIYSPFLEIAQSNFRMQGVGNMEVIQNPISQRENLMGGFLQ